MIALAAKAKRGPTLFMGMYSGNIYFINNRGALAKFLSDNKNL